MLELWSLVTSSRLLLFKDILKKSTNIHIIRVCKSIDKVSSVPVPMNFEKILSFNFFNSYSKFTSLLSAVKMALFNIKSTKSHILLAIILAVQAANSFQSDALGCYCIYDRRANGVIKISIQRSPFSKVYFGERGLRVA